MAAIFKAFVVGIACLVGFACQPQSGSQSTIIISSPLVPIESPQATTTVITPNLLPTKKVVLFKPKAPTSSIVKVVATTTIAAIVKTAPPIPAPQATTSVISTAPITAQSLLADTSVSINPDL